jgi:hypothetical protein
MRPNTLKKLFFSLFFLSLPLIIFAQSNRAQSVALVPFWDKNGQSDEIVAKEFGEELYKGVNDQQGFRSVVIDMTNLPDDVPEGGFPPYICPSPSLIKSNPIALTGELTPDPDDDEYWHLRLYLWEMADTRLVFSDELVGYTREEIAAGMPSTLEWLFSWLTKGGRGIGGDGSEGDTSNLYGGRQVFITTSMPLQWIYIGLRVGASPLRLQDTPKFKEVKEADIDKRYVESRYESVNGALSLSIALFPESIPFFSRFVVQAEGIFNYDFEPQTDKSISPSTMTVTPSALLKFQVYRHGNMLFSLFGGAYTPFALDDKIAYSSLIPIGWTAGLSFGGKLDPLPGVFFIDVRYTSDEFNTFVKKDDEAYRRRAVTISVGYEYGIITKK